ncbi:sialate O-acetylesterase [Coraliomargarita algicola]|uniref:Sialate O-acetylesterase n=1 Tax=Coraliomargarita algicola TaxID=3092156 RepID=A0ABZ0RP67_9BACT|nr:sialate O-acetylesterase [Coraliomargarita sp. J2-16]WPJ96928.1 sialate O-acetylesterase [Coraliomargarita sp. J2-16]
MLALATHALRAEVSLPSIFTDHMVLQRNLANPVWGKATPGENVSVRIDGQIHQTQADANGKWTVKLDPMNAGGPFTLNIEGNNTVTIQDVLIGEVWVCSGQSNMEWPLGRSNDSQLEAKSANYPKIRFITIPRNGTQEPQDDFEGAWEICSPKTVKEFSAIGYYFGWRLLQVLDVPIGLIDNSWGGSMIESWVPREDLQGDPELEAVLTKWDKRMEGYTDETYQQALADYEVAKAAFIAGGKIGNWPHRPSNLARGQMRPANIYNGGVYPIIGYGIKGMLWYQGESNAGEPDRYLKIFPRMLKTYREQWDQGDFPCYWVQLADYKAEHDDPNKRSYWAEMREVQTAFMDRVPNGGQAVIIDVGEGRDIHPRNKRVPADRLARWALAKQYGVDLEYRSPEYESMEIVDNKAILSFKHVRQLYTFDIKEPIGFTIAGEDGQFVWAKAKLVGAKQIEVWSDAVPHPTQVRYGWATNPKVNVYSYNGLPLTPFRTDTPAYLQDQ